MEGKIINIRLKEDAGYLSPDIQTTMTTLGWWGLIYIRIIFIYADNGAWN